MFTCSGRETEKEKIHSGLDAGCTYFAEQTWGSVSTIETHAFTLQRKKFISLEKSKRRDQDGYLTG